MPFQPLSTLATALLVAYSPIIATGQEPARHDPVAVVSSLSGSATVSTPREMNRATIHVFDWLPAGSVIEVDSGSSLTLAFSNGSRYELGENVKATLAADGPKALTGAVHGLASVPRMPRVVAVARGARAGTRSAAIRLRQTGLRIRGLYPREDSASLPESTALLFAPADGAGRYRVEVEDESGRTIFEAETESSVVRVPAGILKAGTRYYWKVRTVGRVGPALRGESEFATLSAQDAEKRAALKASLETNGDAESLALLAEIDHRLGLLTEAREEFRSALSKAPKQEGVRKALEEVEKQLSTDDEGPES
jgi:hypothetical protein